MRYLQLPLVQIQATIEDDVQVQGPGTEPDTALQVTPSCRLYPLECSEQLQGREVGAGEAGGVQEGGLVDDIGRHCLVECRVAHHLHSMGAAGRKRNALVKEVWTFIVTIANRR